MRERASSTVTVMPASEIDTVARCGACDSIEFVSASRRNVRWQRRHYGSY